MKENQINSILWALADQFGGEIRVNKDKIEKAKHNDSLIIMTNGKDTLTIQRVKKSDVDLWEGTDEKRVDIVGQNGNTGEHY